MIYGAESQFSQRRFSSDNTPYEKIGNNDPVSIADEVPFEIPDTWEWVRLKDLVVKEIKRGKSPKYADRGSVFVFAQKCNVKQGGIDMSLAKYLDMNTFPKYPAEEYMQDGDIIINSTGNGTLGRIGMFHNTDRINDYVIVPDSHVTLIRAMSLIQRDYLFHVLRYYQPFLEDQGEGSTNQTELRPATVAELFIPIPPVGEQKRITEKLTKLLPLVDVYGVKAKALDTYNEEFPVQLKKSILQMAVQGKLVPQDPADEPPSVLLERIRAEKQRLIKEGKIKKDKHESVIFRRVNSHYEKLDGIERCIDDEIPFEIPDAWCYCRLGTILHKLTDGTHAKPKYVSSGVPFISVKDVSSGKLDFSNCKFITDQEHRELFSRCDPEYGDILLTKVGTTGIPVIVDTNDEFSLFVSVALLKFNQELICNRYLIHLLNSPLVQTQAEENTRGVGNKNWVMRDIANTIIVIPPLSEQYRIVTELDKVLPLTTYSK